MCIRLLLIFYNDFLSDCPSLMQGIGIRYVQHCQAMLERGVCELAHYFGKVRPSHLHILVHVFAGQVLVS